MKARARPLTPLSRHTNLTPTIQTSDEEWTDIDDTSNKPPTEQKTTAAKEQPDRVRILEDALRTEIEAHYETRQQLLATAAELEFLEYTRQTSPNSSWCSFFTCCIQPDLEEPDSPDPVHEQSFEETNRRPPHVNTRHR